MDNCPSCNSSNVSKFKGWVEDIDNPEFNNTYNEAYWNFMVCKDCKLQTFEIITDRANDPPAK